MDYAELESVFNINPFYKDPVPQETVIKADEPVQQTQEQNVYSCAQYESHVNSCPTCMYNQTRKRSNLVNILIIFALLWLIFRK